MALVLSACGSGHKLSGTTSTVVHKQEAALTATAQRDLKRCLPIKDGAPDFLVLKSHAARHAFANCAVPPAKRAAFNACVTKVALGGVPTKVRLEQGGMTCLAKAER